MRKFVTLDPPERWRRYQFGNGITKEIRDVVKLAVSDSGNHYLEDAKGRKYIIAPDWLTIEIDVDDWST